MPEEHVSKHIINIDGKLYVPNDILVDLRLKYDLLVRKHEKCANFQGKNFHEKYDKLKKRYSNITTNTNIYCKDCDVYNCKKHDFTKRLNCTFCK